MGARQRRRPHAQGSAQGSWVKRVGVRAWFELHSITASFRDVRRLPLGEGREWQALQRIHRAPVLDVDERARVLERVGVVVQIRMQSRNRLMGHAARLARHRGVLRVRHLHVVVLGRLGAPLVHLRLRHEDLAVVPALVEIGTGQGRADTRATCQRVEAQRACRARATVAAGHRPRATRAAVAARTIRADRAPRVAVALPRGRVAGSDARVRRRTVCLRSGCSRGCRCRPRCRCRSRHLWAWADACLVCVCVCVDVVSFYRIGVYRSSRSTASSQRSAARCSCPP